MPRVLIVRGHLVTPWELGPWAALPDRFEVSFLLTGSNRFELPSGRLRPLRVRALRDYLPRGRLGELGASLVGDRYVGATSAFATADIVHAEELSFWFAADAARQRSRHGFKLVQTVWETLPLLGTFRTRRAQQARREVLESTDLFLPTTQRAADALVLEGVDPTRIRVCPPGIDVTRFRTPQGMDAPWPYPPDEHVILSPGRLVWEKGHQDVLRAIAAIKRGLVGGAGPSSTRVRLLIVGSGPEEPRLRDYARELGLEAEVEFRSVPYEEMPSLFGHASGMVLASLPWAGVPYHVFDRPRVFWEEQFGLVLAEAMAARLDIVATDSGAIPEVLTGAGARLVPAGAWIEIAEALVDGPLSRPPGERVEYPAEVIERYSTGAAADRLAAIYDRLLA